MGLDKVQDCLLLFHFNCLLKSRNKLTRISHADSINDCAASEIDAEELANWLTMDDRELVANYHKLSAHDKSIIKRLARMMSEKK